MIARASTVLFDVRRILVVIASLSIAAIASADPRLAKAAAEQIGVTKHYDPSYVRLAYPGGDVPLDRGVCTDVVIRAFRTIGVDLQREVHEDMRRSFREYPQMWGLRAPDRNIDHRRVPNLMAFFARKGKRHGRDAAYEPGDVVAWRLPSGLHHIGVVSETRVPRADRYFMIHNIGAGAASEDILYQFEILGHYRW